MRSPVLVMRRGGVLWAVSAAAVRNVAARPSGVGLDVGRVEIVADAVLAVSRDLEIRRTPAALRRWWPTPVAGLTSLEGVPVVVVDHEDPPPMLLEPKEGSPDDAEL